MTLVCLKQAFSTVAFQLLKLAALGLSRKLVKACTRLLSCSADLAISSMVNTSSVPRHVVTGSEEESREVHQLHHSHPFSRSDPQLVSTSSTTPPPTPIQGWLPVVEFSHRI